MQLGVEMEGVGDDVLTMRVHCWVNVQMHVCVSVCHPNYALL